jgi:hypothetical protein
LPKVERSTREAAITDMSSSRIRVAAECMLKFDYQYRHRLPASGDKASGIFGNVIHGGLETWYGGHGPITPDNANAHHEQSLVDIVKASWPDKLPPKIWQLVETVIQADQECEAVSYIIKAKRPELKSPRQTKEFLKSTAWKEYNEAVMAMLKLCGDFNEISWPNDENAFQAYQKSIAQARRIEAEWRHLPRPLLVEEPFRLEFEGYVLRGAIDQVRQDPDSEGVLLSPAVWDVKTGRQLMTQMQAFWQAWIYTEAVHQMDYDFLPDNITDVRFFMTRHIDGDNRIIIQEAQVDRARHGKLALRILNSTTRRILTGDNEPSYGFHCKNCDFRDLCEHSIALWKGDGVK